MKRLEAITKAVNKYETLYGDLKFSKHFRAKILNKEQMILGLISENAQIYFNFASQSGYGQALKKILKEKPNNISYYNWLLLLIELSECKVCTNILHIEYFYNNRYSICKECYSNKSALYYNNTINYRKEYCKNYSLDHPEKGRERTSKYRASKLKRTPKWLTEEDQWMFKEIYSLAKQREELTGIKWHVDHIIPLQGELVCGLHVPTNLQVITATENLSKSNKFNI